jgi:hypothetical protein
MLMLPTPPVFVSEEHDETWTVIDGHQRLETLFRFMQPLLSGPSAGRPTQYAVLAPLTLRALEVIPELNGQGILALSRDDRNKFWETRITVVRLPASTHPDLKYALFARLNQGSMSLNNQELRNCLYRGPYNKVIAQLAEDRPWLHLWGKNSPDKRMRDRELVLRFFAALHRGDKYRTPFRAFLNDEMESNQYLKLVGERQCREEFSTALVWVSRVFGDETYRLFRGGDANNHRGQWSSRRYELIYEVESVNFVQFGTKLQELWDSGTGYDQEMLRLAIRTAAIDVMVNPRFTDTLWAGTTRTEAVNTRYQLWSQALRHVTDNHEHAIEQARKLHQGLSESNVCCQCPNQVTPDDAVLITLDGKPMIVHRFCRTT